jgi:hypothetical protein
MRTRYCCLWLNAFLLPIRRAVCARAVLPLSCPFLAARAAGRGAPAAPFKHAAVNLDALRSEIRLALINQKANACPSQ